MLTDSILSNPDVEKGGKQNIFFPGADQVNVACSPHASIVTAFKGLSRSAGVPMHSYPQLSSSQVSLNIATTGGGPLVHISTRRGRFRRSRWPSRPARRHRCR